MPETGSSGTVGGLGRKAQPYPESYRDTACDNKRTSGMIPQCVYC